MKIYIVSDAKNIIYRGINHSMIFNTNDYNQFKNHLPYESKDLIKITTSPVANINCDGLTACNGYCITVETKNSIYHLQNINKANYFDILDQIST